MAIDPDYKWVTSWTDRHGKTRYRFRRSGLPERCVRGAPHTPQFDSDYALAMSGAPKNLKPQRAASPIRSCPLLADAARCGEVVYIIGDRRGPVKIGWTVTIRKRLKAIRISSINDVRLIAFMPGGRDLERQIHARLQAARIRGEWFRRTVEVQAFIDEALANLSEFAKKSPLNQLKTLGGGAPGGIETSPLIQVVGDGEPPFMTNGKLRRPDAVGEPFGLSGDSPVGEISDEAHRR